MRLRLPGSVSLHRKREIIITVSDVIKEICYPWHLSTTWKKRSENKNGRRNPHIQVFMNIFGVVNVRKEKGRPCEPLPSIASLPPAFQ